MTLRWRLQRQTEGGRRRESFSFPTKPTVSNKAPTTRILAELTELITPTSPAGSENRAHGGSSETSFSFLEATCRRRR